MERTYFLDTNICVYYMKGLHPRIKNKLLGLSPESIKIPVIVKAELLYGAEKSKQKKENLEKINSFLLPFEIVSFGDEAAPIYALLRTDLEKKGRLIGPNDLIIASIVVSYGGTLVTNNTEEFKRIKSIKLEDWTK